MADRVTVRCNECGWTTNAATAVDAMPKVSKRRNNCPVTTDRQCQFDCVVPALSSAVAKDGGAE